MSSSPPPPPPRLLAPRIAPCRRSLTGAVFFASRRRRLRRPLPPTSPSAAGHARADGCFSFRGRRHHRPLPPPSPPPPRTPQLAAVVFPIGRGWSWRRPHPAPPSNTIAATGYLHTEKLKMSANFSMTYILWHTENVCQTATGYILWIFQWLTFCVLLKMSEKVCQTATGYILWIFQWLWMWLKYILSLIPL